MLLFGCLDFEQKIMIASGQKCVKPQLFKPIEKKLRGVTGRSGDF